MGNTQNVITAGIFDIFLIFYIWYLILLRINQSSVKVREHNKIDTLPELNIIKLWLLISICIVIVFIY